MFIVFVLLAVHLDMIVKGKTNLMHNLFLAYFFNNPTKTTDRHLKRIISTNCCIYTVVPPDDGPRDALNMQSLTKYTKNKLCIKLVFLCTNVIQCPACACFLSKTLAYKLVYGKGRHHSFKTGNVVYCGLKGSDLCRQLPFPVDTPNFLRNVPQLIQYNRPNVTIIHPSETITVLTFATHPVEDMTETTTVV